jgi:hypothetical protein
MPFNDEVSNIVAQLTDKGRNLSARVTSEGLSYKFHSWALGRGGYNMSNPVEIVDIDTSFTALIDQIYPSAITRIPFIETDFEYPTSRTISLMIRIARETAGVNYGIGEIGIWVEIVASPTNPLEIGEMDLFAVAHMPIQPIMRNTAKVWRMLVNF